MSRHLFVSAATDTVEEIDGDCWIIDTYRLTDDEAQLLDDATTLGSFGPECVAILERVAVRVSDLLAAYKWREALREAGIMGDVEELVVRVWPNSEQVTA